MVGMRVGSAARTKPPCLLPRAAPCVAAAYADATSASAPAAACFQCMPNSAAAALASASSTLQCAPAPSMMTVQPRGHFVLAMVRWAHNSVQAGVGLAQALWTFPAPGNTANPPQTQQLLRRCEHTHMHCSHTTLVRRTACPSAAQLHEAM
jgi:hypothetical protein